MIAPSARKVNIYIIFDDLLPPIRQRKTEIRFTNKPFFCYNHYVVRP